ncbi:hypothetical protein [Bacillus massiliigorillae]|uniref:hypothetical protein n=1 Tax=Bacillus massiliigorillae TaxID=1243664 RepID=UPI001E34414C|nr:hypothetical protein [Bacillus massiliigorillae]
MSKHNIVTGEQIAQMFNSFLGKASQNSKSAYSEYEEILGQVNNASFISVPFTENENQRATFVNNLIK